MRDDVKIRPHFSQSEGRIVRSSSRGDRARPEEAFSVSQLARRAGVREDDVERLLSLGIVATRGGRNRFSSSDVQRIEFANACEEAGLPLDVIGSAIRGRRLSLQFLEASPYRRWAERSDRTYSDVSDEAGVPFEALRDALEAMGFASAGSADQRIRDDELEVLPLLGLGLSTGVLDDQWIQRLGRAYVQGLRTIVRTESELYRSRFVAPARASGADDETAMAVAAESASDYLSLVDRALMGVHRHQQELVLIENLVEHFEAELEASGRLARGRVPALCFLDLVGFTALTEERGDEAAAEVAAVLASLVDRSARDHRGSAIKWLGDGLMVYFREPRDAVSFSLEIVEEIPGAGLPPVRVGVAAGPVVTYGGDYFGRTVNLAARIAARAEPGKILVSESSVIALTPDAATFVEMGHARLKGFSEPIELFEPLRVQAA